MSGFSEGASADHYRDTDVEENTPGSYRQRSDSDLVRSYYYGSCDPAPTPPASEGQRTNWGFVRDDPSPEFGAGGRGNNGFGAGGERVVQRVSLELNEIGKADDLDDSDPDAMKAPSLLRKAMAEFLGTYLLVLFGDGAIAQYKMLEGPQSNFLSVALGYGFALMIGILASGGVSGGHLNPAVTLAMACIKKCAWTMVPIYWAAQYGGALLGAATVYGVYADGINALLGKNVTGGAGIFASYPNAYASTVTLVADQALGTACLLVIILSVTDGRNMKVASGLVAPLIGLGLAAIHISFAFNAGCAINPARDFSPRLLTLMAGFGSETFSTADYFFWIPWLMPHIGGVIGALVYYFMIEHHHDEDDDE